MSKDQNPSDKACDAYFDNPCAATSGSYYSDRVTFYAGFAAGAASRDAEIAELVSLLDAINEHMNVPGWCEFSTNEDAMNYHKTADRLEKALTITKVRKP